MIIFIYLFIIAQPKTPPTRKKNQEKNKFKQCISEQYNLITKKVWASRYHSDVH